MQVEAIDLLDGLEIKLSLTKLECDILKDNVMGRQGIIEWYSKGPSQQKVIHAAKVMGKREKESPKLFMELGKLTEVELEECMCDPIKMAEKIILMPDYKNHSVRETEKHQYEIDQLQVVYDKAVADNDTETAQAVQGDMNYFQSRIDKIAAYNA